jgi:hypothetical protein
MQTKPYVYIYPEHLMGDQMYNQLYQVHDVQHQQQLILPHEMDPLRERKRFFIILNSSIYLLVAFSRRGITLNRFYCHDIAFYQIYMLYLQDLIELTENHCDDAIQLLLDHRYTKIKYEENR